MESIIVDVCVWYICLYLHFVCVSVCVCVRCVLCVCVFFGIVDLNFDNETSDNLAGQRNLISDEFYP